MRYQVKSRNKYEENRTDHFGFGRIRYAQMKRLIGCDLGEIEQIKIAQNVDSLPESYKDFMILAGKMNDFISTGSDVAYPTVCGLKRSMLQTMHIEWPEYEFTDPIYVFYSHQGYQFSFFYCNEDSEDPPFITTILAKKRLF